MIRTLLVDDEPIVRKGLLHIMPWERHGMTVVADVGSGEKALEWLTREKIDLLVTDLTMPGMSGFDLIQEVQVKFPSVGAAILTCHQEFHYVQEALRMGALDYIVKTELDEEKLDRLFGRIAERVREKQVREAEAAPQPAPGGRDGVLFVGLAADCSLNELYAVPWITERMPYRVADANPSWFVDSAGGGKWPADARSLLPADRWVIVFLHHLAMKDRLRELLPIYVRKHVFYLADLKEGAPALHDSLRDVMLHEDHAGGTDWRSAWESFEWTCEDHAWRELIERIQKQRPEPADLCEVMYRTMRSWQGIKRFGDAARYLESARALRTWSDWKRWLDGLRRGLSRAIEEAGVGQDNAVRILKSIHQVQQRLREGVTQEEAAAAIHFSRGYFSDCFKRTVGSTFNEFMRELRIDWAKMWLVGTELSIGEISQRCGFADEPYFRKLFRDETGYSPKDYRRLPAVSAEFELAYLGRKLQGQM
ncbi:response regulator transcription factor [Paenibacillus sacheonensis]|uniref:Response regulator n=1 Tax=Paenibacillus sacheonensis TaxID=742054 RepID=A0A7X4YQY7_9BACL|nr:response regulator [Paenibacillus sacheonensis]MBM7567172.1 two-component system response regulator YesN [Paenibacillus sacheonensis]NBC70903.1 response regulator [Paenibacillus sacheonensis]